MRKHSKQFITDIANSFFEGEPRKEGVITWYPLDGEYLARNRSFYHGKIDITTVINFHEVAGMHELTPGEYDELINKCQKIADKKLLEFFNP